SVDAGGICKGRSGWSLETLSSSFSLVWPKAMAGARRRITIARRITVTSPHRAGFSRRASVVRAIAALPRSDEADVRIRVVVKPRIPELGEEPCKTFVVELDSTVQANLLKLARVPPRIDFGLCNHASGKYSCAHSRWRHGLVKARVVWLRYRRCETGLLEKPRSSHRAFR